MTDAQPRFPRILPAGDSALILEFGEGISTGVHDLVVAMDRHLSEHPIRGVTECVPTYRSLMICHDPMVIRGRALGQALMDAARGLRTNDGTRRRWHVPVLYGHEAGLDLDELAAMKGLSTTELIGLHGSVDLRVYMIGFAPGFTYLGGLPDILHTPRLKVPRQMTPAGGIAIGGAQACVGALPGPSGWRFLGRTPLRAFDPGRAEAFVFRAGDLVRFHPVTQAEADRLDARSAAGEICAEQEIMPQSTQHP
ncbi:MAG: 5-oxoprolinase subunit PxpB [Paracoccus sp. (in: a-proteobacteria)]|uniref:5-oxoprolinase subunit PxpB n=1 Tax=Paracoccus sp. TaxID=267 RepID=UPI0039E5F5C2